MSTSSASLTQASKETQAATFVAQPWYASPRAIRPSQRRSSGIGFANRVERQRWLKLLEELKMELAQMQQEREAQENLETPFERVWRLHT